MTSFIQEQDAIRQDYVDENIYKGKRFTWKNVLCNTSVQGWIFIGAFALSVPLLTYYLVVDRGSSKVIDTDTCYVNETFRVPCGKVNISENDCVSLSCCYDTPTQKCYHYLPSRYSYDLSSDGKYKVSKSKSPFGTKTLDTLKVSVNEINSNRVSIYLHRETDVVPNSIIVEDKNYIVNKTDIRLMVEIFRPNGDLLLSTAKGPLIASTNYWEWTIYLTDHSLFGINQTLIKLDVNSTLTKVFYNSKNDQSSMPLFWAYTNGQFHGVTVNHEGPLEMTILPSNMVVLKSLVGGVIEIQLSVGPTPSLLHDQQRQKDVENLPYWFMGTHICQRQEIYRNMSYLIENFDEDLEGDSFCIDENLFMYLLIDDIAGKNDTDVLNETLSTLASQGKKFLLSIPPQILKNSALETTALNLDLLYKFNETVYQGKYLKKAAVYPDYTHPNSQQYLKEIENFLIKYFNNISIDGIILTDNWPANEDFLMDAVSFPYFNKDLQDALSHTIQWNATVSNITHMEKHNSYGVAQYEAFKRYFNSSIVITSATKSFTQIQPTIIQNVDASWDNLQDHLANLLFNSVAGNHFVSLPVCGDTSEFNNDTQESLCLRWYIVAATLPLFRISSPQPWRNPDQLKTQFAQQIAKDLVEKRKTFLPYYYAIAMKNQPIIRPMFYDFFENTTTFSIKNQYMVGEKILVAHPLSSQLTKLTVYLPPRIGIWYEFWGGEMFRTNKTNPYISVDVRQTDFVAFIAQGSIVPLVKEAQINLIVALNCTGNLTAAEGSIQIEDLIINFNATDEYVTFNSSADVVNYVLGYIRVFGYNNATSYTSYYTKNVNLTDGTINYVDSTTTETSSTTTTIEPTTEPEPSSPVTDSSQQTNTNEPTTVTEPSSPVTDSSQETTTNEPTKVTESSSPLTDSSQQTSTNEPTTVTEPSSPVTDSSQQTSTNEPTTVTEPSSPVTDSSQQTSTNKPTTVTEPSSPVTDGSQQTSTNEATTVTEPSSPVTDSSQQTTTNEPTRVTEPASSPVTDSSQ